MFAVVPMSAWPASICASLRLPVSRKNSVMAVWRASVALALAGGVLSHARSHLGGSARASERSVCAGDGEQPGCFPGFSTSPDEPASSGALALRGPLETLGRRGRRVRT